MNKNVKRTKSDYAFITLHGYLESSYTMSFLNQRLEKNNFTVISPDLIGHGTHFKNLNHVKYNDWTEQIFNCHEKCRSRNKETIIVGYSLGGLLALHAAQNLNVKAIVLINHLYDSFPFSMLLTPIGQHFFKYVPALKPDIKNKEPFFLYKWISTKNTAEIVKLGKVVENNIEKVNCPVLIFKSMQDNRVNRKNAVNTYDIVSSKKELIFLENSYHTAPLDFDKELIVENILRFVGEVIDDN